METKGDTFKYNGGSDEPGPIVVKLLETLQGIQRGKIQDTFGWNEEVKAEKETHPKGNAVQPTGAGGNMVDELP